jgi:fumarate hydratase subunit alpha
MRTVTANKIKDVVSELCLRANFVLRSDVYAALARAYRREKNKRAKEILSAIIRNANIARREKLAICQDTGLAAVFVELGQGLKLSGDLRQAINKGIESGYRRGFLRNSVVKHPLCREKPGYQPAMLHVELVKGSKIKLTVLPKGFGCENKTRLKMFNPTAKISEIKEFIVETVKSAGPDACPPYVVGVGIGGSADYACLLAKKALLKKIAYGGRHAAGSEQKKIADLEKQLLIEINRLGIGPMGLGGKVTALAVNICTYSTHIAGLPVCVNISCHALRSATKTL